MTAPSSSYHCRGSIALSLLILCCCSRVVSSFAVARPFWIEQRLSNSVLTLFPTCRAATKNEVLNDSQEQLETPTTTKNTTRKKNTSTVKAQGMKEKKNGVKAETTKKREKKKKSNEPAFWRNETDYFMLLDQNLNNVTSHDDAHMIRFLIR